MSARLRILVLRSDNIGDAVMFSGALRPLRAHWPEARIDLMVPSSVRPLFAHCPYVDQVRSIHRLMPWEGLRRVIQRGTWALERVMLREPARFWWYPRYDIVFYAVSAPIEPYLRAVRLMKARDKWGYAGDQLRLYDLEDEANRPERVFTRAFVNLPEDRWMHEQERTRRFLQFIGVEPGPMAPELWLTRRDAAFARHALPEREVLGVFIGANSAWRQWPREKWIALGRQQRTAPRVALFGGPAERALAAAIGGELRRQGVAVHDLAGRTKLGELAACIGRCKAVVSNDSSGLHLAVAGSVPAVGILGGYHFGRYYPWGNARIHRVAHVPMDCYHCNDACRYGDWRCVSSVPVERVLRELDAAVAGHVAQT